jgi:hypothetical protein
MLKSAVVAASDPAPTYSVLPICSFHFDGPGLVWLIAAAAKPRSVAALAAII